MSGTKRTIGSDLDRVDGHQNTAADYDEIPEITDEQFRRAKVKRPIYPRVLDLVRALARQAAREDHKAELEQLNSRVSKRERSCE